MTQTQMRRDSERLLSGTLDHALLWFGTDSEQKCKLACQWLLTSSDRC